MYELLVSADLFVDDPAQCVDQLQKVIGLPAPRDNWIHGPTDCPYHVVFARTYRKLLASPTILEIVGVNVANPLPHLLNRFTYQGDRQTKTHATVFASSSYDEVLERLKRAGIRYLEEQPDERFAFPRLWPGLSPHDRHYDASVDGGLMTEVIPLPGMGYPTPMAEALIPDDLSDGDLLRIAARTFLVSDLSGTLDALHRTLDLVATREWVVSDEGYKVAVFEFPFPGSARLELIQPLDDTHPAGMVRSRWGPGAYSIRVSAWGLEAWAEKAAKNGITATRLAATTGIPERLIVDPELTCGTMFEIVEGRPG